MLHTLHPNTDWSQESYTKSAEVTQVDGSTIYVRLEHNGASINVSAQLAIPAHIQLQQGDTVLISGTGIGQCFIIGLLGESRSKLQSVVSQSGAIAGINKVAKSDGKVSELLMVKDKSGHLLFDHDSSTGQSRIYTPSGDLSFMAPEGEIKFVSGKKIKCASLEAIELESSNYISMNAGASQVIAGKKGVITKSEKISIESERAQLKLKNTQLFGETFNGTIERSKLVVGKLETVAKRIVESAINVYRKAEQLSQLKTKRSRTIVEKDNLVQAGSVNLQAKENVRIDGKGIHLG